jgi:hypothetical protein
MVNFLTCPVCGFQMERGLYRREGFRCPKCSTALHADESLFYLDAVVSIAIASLVSYIADLAGLMFVLGTVVLAGLLFVLGCVGLAYYYPKLAVGLPSFGRVTLQIHSPEDKEGEANEQADE